MLNCTAESSNVVGVKAGEFGLRVYGVQDWFVRFRVQGFGGLGFREFRENE